MVSFSCEVCNDTVVKKKLQQHQYQCRGSYFTCIDCSTTFYNNEHVKHTSCISEAEKYEKSLYKGKKKNVAISKQSQKQPIPSKVTAKAEKQESTKEFEKQDSKRDQKKNKNRKEKSELDLKKYIGSEPISLYKIFKSAKKDKKVITDKTEFLKDVKVIQTDDGNFQLLV